MYFMGKKKEREKEFYGDFWKQNSIKPCETSLLKLIINN